MKLTHPDSTQTIDVDEARVEMYVSQGWRPATTDAPKGNAPLGEWQAFAREKGFTDDDLEGKTRDDLRTALS